MYTVCYYHEGATIEVVRDSEDHFAKIERVCRRGGGGGNVGKILDENCARKFRMMLDEVVEGLLLAGQ